MKIKKEGGDGKKKGTTWVRSREPVFFCKKVGNAVYLTKYWGKVYAKHINAALGKNMNKFSFSLSLAFISIGDAVGVVP